MDFPVTLLGQELADLPLPGAAGIAAWIAGAGLLIYLVWRARGLEARWTAGRIALLAALLLLSAAFVLFTGARFPLQSGIVLADDIGTREDVLFIALLAVPWVLAAGFSGPVMSIFVAGFTGVLLALFATRNPHTILVLAALGLLNAVLLRQRYRTRFFALLRRPLMAALALSLLYPLFFLPAAALGPGAELLIRLNFAFGVLLPEAAAMALSLLVGGLAGELAARAAPAQWGSRAGLVPSPAETSLETRSFQSMGVFIIGAVLALSILGWSAAYRSASDLVRSRMLGSARLAAQSLPNALDTGQSLVQIYLADPRLADPDAAVAAAALDEKLGTGLYFVELMLVGPDGTVFAEASLDTAAGGPLSAAEASGVALAGQGVPFQYYPGGGAPASLSFIVPVPGAARVLVGRSLLAENPFIAPLLASMQNLDDIEGQGLLVDENGLILHHPVEAMVNTLYAGGPELEENFRESVTPAGRPALVYSVPVEGRSWRVVVEVPLAAVQALAVRIAAPFAALLLALAATSLLTLRVILRWVTGSLRTLADQAARIAETRAGIGTPIAPSGVDEVGRLRSAFERMRASLKARMDEQELLLRASHGAASSLDFSEAVKPVLTAALATGAEAVRVVLAPELGADPVSREVRSYGAGSAANRFAYLDEQLLRVLERQPTLATGNPVAVPDLSFGAGAEIPGAVAAVALRHDRDFLGVIWIAFTSRRPFSEDEVRFLTALAAQASLAVANTRLFRSAQVGRERLDAILASSPDPILVTDREHRLILANQAAVDILGESLAGGAGRPIETLLDFPNLVELIRSDLGEASSSEIKLESEETYIARVKALVFRGAPYGKVCILRDITRYKELETFRSKMFADVIHELEQPLTVIQGYATMLPLQGEVNPEQLGNIEKISYGIKRMKDLVLTLADIGKVEAGIGLEMAEVSLLDIVVSVGRELHPLALGRNVRLAIAPPSEQIPPILGDRDHLRRAVGNLIENAIKYTDGGGSVGVTVAARKQGRLVRLSVQDDGLGISLQDQERLFGRFFRSSNPEAKKRPGTGLGLAIVKSIIEAHGGRIWIESILGVGSTFHVELPAIVSADSD